MDKKLTDPLETMCIVLLTNKLYLYKEPLYYWRF